MVSNPVGLSPYPGGFVGAWTDTNTEGTSEIEVFSFKCDGRTVHLIDTLSFNDTHRTDSDVLKDLVFWLDASYHQQIRLSGMVYLHPIHESKYQSRDGSALLFFPPSSFLHTTRLL